MHGIPGHRKGVVAPLVILLVVVLLLGVIWVAGNTTEENKDGTLFGLLKIPICCMQIGLRMPGNGRWLTLLCMENSLHLCSGRSSQ